MHCREWPLKSRRQSHFSKAILASVSSEADGFRMGHLRVRPVGPRALKKRQRRWPSSAPSSRPTTTAFQFAATATAAPLMTSHNEASEAVVSPSPPLRHRCLRRRDRPQGAEELFACSRCFHLATNGCLRRRIKRLYCLRSSIMSLLHAQLCLFAACFLLFLS